MYYVGLDSHWKTSTACILDSNGKELTTFTARGGWSKMIQRLETFVKAAAEANPKLTICYEASCGYGALYDRLAKIAHRLVVAHPGQLRLIFWSKTKNDRMDARRLAKLLFLDEVPQVHVPDLKTRDWRKLIEFRRSTVDKRTQTKNAIQSLLRGHGIAKPTDLKSLWSGDGRAWLRSLSWPSLDASLQCEILLDQLDQIEAQVKKVTTRLDQIAKNHPGVHLLKTIPGVGPRTAEAYLAYVDDPNRFAKSKQVGNYFGFTPCQDASADANRLGHITKDGPATARKLLVEAAWQAIRRHPGIKGYFERIAHGKKDRRKIALVATAHYLTRVMWQMLKTGQVWNPDQGNLVNDGPQATTEENSPRLAA